MPEAEIVALIAYLQRLGMDIKAEKTAEMKDDHRQFKY